MLSTLLVLVSITTSHNTFVSILEDEDLTIAALVLGKSIDLTHTNHHKILLTTFTSEKHRFEKEGWEVRIIKSDSVDAYRPITSLFTSGLSTTVVLISPTMMVQSSVDELFLCGNICAVERDKEFDTALMVLNLTDSTLHAKIVAHAQFTSPEITEHQLLNLVFSNFDFMPMFVPDERPAFQVPNEVQHRLPNLYSGDVFLYYMRNSMWWESRSGPKVVHFYGPSVVEPWHWNGYYLLSLHWTWYDVFRTIQPLEHPIISFIRLLVPLVVLRLVRYPLQAAVTWCSNVEIAFFSNMRNLVGVDSLLTVVGMIWMIFGLAMALLLTPNISSNVHPLLCWLLMFEWFGFFGYIFMFAVQHILLRYITSQPSFGSQHEIPSTNSELHALLSLVAFVFIAVCVDFFRLHSGLVFLVHLAVYLMMFFGLGSLILYRLPVIFAHRVRAGKGVLSYESVREDELQ